MVNDWKSKMAAISEECKFGFDINPRKTSRARHLWHSYWYGTLPAVCVFDHIRPVPYDPLDDRLDREEEKQPRSMCDLISRVMLNNNRAESRVRIATISQSYFSLYICFLPIILPLAFFVLYLFNLLNNSFIRINHLWTV